MPVELVIVLVPAVFPADIRAPNHHLGQASFGQHVFEPPGSLGNVERGKVAGV